MQKMHRTIRSNDGEGKDSSATPILYGKRRFLTLVGNMGDTTSCQKTSNPDDYGPDD